MANPAKPTALRKLQGNPGKRPLNTREPQPTVLASADPPGWLDDAAKEAWRQVVPRLCALHVVSEIDLQALGMMFDSWGEWYAARQTVREKGMTFEVTEMRTDENGVKVREVVSIRRRPEVAIAADAYRRVRAFMNDFGMTAAARVRLVTSDEVDEADPFDAWLGRERA